MVWYFYLYSLLTYQPLNKKIIIIKVDLVKHTYIPLIVLGENYILNPII